MLLLFINPTIDRKQFIIQKSKLSVLVDNSTSIKFFQKDTLVQSIIDDFKTHSELNKRFDINYYSFGDKFQLNDSLQFNESQTNIADPLNKVNKVLINDSNAIVLITDGNQTVGNDYEYSSIKNPVFPLVVGDTTQYEDVKISQLNVNRYSFINNQFPVEIFLQYEGNQSLKLRYTIENKGKIIYSKLIRFSPQKNSQRIEASIKATQEGSNFYKAKIEYLENEKNKTNNLKNFSVEVIDKQTEVLILSSFYHPDLGALKKSIESDQQRKVSIRTLSKNNIKLNDFQLVILYQPNNDFKEIINDLTTKKANYFLISGSKTDWNFVNNQNIGIRKNYLNQDENYTASFNAGFLNFSQKDIGFDNFPPLVNKYGETSINIPHQTLFFQNINGFTTQEPLLATSNVNNHKKVFLMGEGLWKWRSTSYLNSNSFQDFDEFIGNLVQFASSKKVRNRIDVNIEPIYNANARIQVGAFYVDENYQFDDRATLLFTTINKETKEKKVIPFSLTNNSYQLELTVLESGDYEYSVDVEGQNITKKGVFKINQFEIEQQFTNANKEKLQRLSNKSEGVLYFENQETSLIDQLLTDKRFLSIQKSVNTKEEIINLKWLLAIIVFLLSSEWLTRKYFGKI
ncbi:MAG: vWA domain-containing protein [Flavobacteriaceae bacterium]